MKEFIKKYEGYKWMPSVKSGTFGIIIGVIKEGWNLIKACIC